MSESLLRWLSVRPSHGGLVVLTVGYLVFVYLWYQVSISVVDSIYSDHYYQYWSGQYRDRNRGWSPLPTTFSGWAYAAFIEELDFRLKPLAVVLLLYNLSTRFKWLILPTAIIASAWFGLAHVSNYSEVTPFAILFSLGFQGVLGFGLSLLFLKYAGLQVSRVIGATLFTTTVHLAWNLLVLANQL